MSGAIRPPGRERRPILGEQPAEIITIPGKSAYELWLDQGNVGDMSAYLASLIGPRGPQGDIGPAGTAGPDNVLVGSAVPLFASPADDGMGLTWNANGWAKTSLVDSATLAAHTALTTSAHGGIVAVTDPRLSDSRPPTGAADGDLSGSYPSPTVARLGGVALGSYVNPNNVALAPGAAGRNTVQPSGVGYAAFVLKQGVGSAGDLQQWQISDSTIKAKVDSLGNSWTPVLVTGDWSLVPGGSVPLQVISTLSSRVASVVRGATGQTADLIQAQFSNGSNAFRVDSSGNAFAPGYGDLANAVAFVSTNTDATHGWVLTSKTSAKVPFTVKAAAAQSQNLTEWQDSNGTMLGNISAGGAPRFSQAVIGPTSTGIGAGVHLLTLASAAANVPLVARASAAQTASRQEWQDNAGVAQLTVNAAGQLGFNPTTAPVTPTTGCLVYYAVDGLHMKSSLGNDRLVAAA